MFHFSVELDKPKETISQAKERPNLRERHFFLRGSDAKQTFQAELVHGLKSGNAWKTYLSKITYSSFHENV